MDQKGHKWKPSSNRWLTNAIKLSFEIPWEMWEDRNNYLHHDDHPWKQEDEQQMNIEIQEIYEDLTNSKQETTFTDPKERLAPIGVHSTV